MGSCSSLRVFRMFRGKIDIAVVGVTLITAGRRDTGCLSPFSISVELDGNKKGTFVICSRGDWFLGSGVCSGVRITAEYPNLFAVI